MAKTQVKECFCFTPKNQGLPKQMRGPIVAGAFFNPSHNLINNLEW